MSVPVLIYDDACDLCRLWVTRWRARTVDRARYVTIEAARGEFHGVSEEVFRRAVTLMLPSGEQYQGAKAVLRLLAESPSGKKWWWCHQHLPLFALLSELFYRAISSCRDCAYRFSKLMIREKGL